MGLTHIDCFSGPGGICTGLHAAGFETKVAIEYIKSCVDTYSRNHPEVHVIHSDIRNVTKEQIEPYIPKDGALVNTPEDIAGLNAWGKDFDLYAVQTVHGEQHIFGCIQSKTSIRDRVGRDVTFSRNAMEGLFWSVGVTLDGDFLNMQEFIHMVNGGGSYPQNGWHGMYAMSGIENSNGRIYKADVGLNLFIDHAIQAVRQFISDRRKLNVDWRAL